MESSGSSATLGGSHSLGIMNPHRASRTLDHLMIFSTSHKEKLCKVSCLIPKDGNQHFKKKKASNLILQI